MKALKISELIKKAESRLEDLNYKPGTIVVYQRFWKCLDSFSKEKGQTEYSEELGTMFLKEVFGWPSEDANSKYIIAAVRSVRMLGDLQLHGIILKHKQRFYHGWEECYQHVLDDFKEYMIRKNLSKGSIERIEHVVIKLFLYLLAQGIEDCCLLSHTHIEGFTKTLSGYARKTQAVSIYSLRVFLNYLFESAIIKEELQKNLPTIHCVNRRNVPSTWSEDETERILNSIDTSNPCGKRDFAILLIATRLGLRQGDIINLCFEDFDWRKCIVTVKQTKTKKAITLPLTDEVGNAIINYLKNGRPASNEPFLFVKHQYPFEQLYGIYPLMGKYLRHAKLEPRRAGNQKGPHTLRHSLASRLLENQVPIETISAILGHSSINSTLDYLKIDILALSSCALDPEEVYENE